MKLEIYFFLKKTLSKLPGEDYLQFLSAILEILSVKVMVCSVQSEPQVWFISSLFTLLRSLECLNFLYLFFISLFPVLTFNYNRQACLFAFGALKYANLPRPSCIHITKAADCGGVKPENFLWKHMIQFTMWKYTYLKVHLG